MSAGTTKSYYFGTGTRRHAARDKTGDYVRLKCGMSGLIGVKVFATDVEPNCRQCLAAGCPPPESSRAHE